MAARRLRGQEAVMADQDQKQLPARRLRTSRERYKSFVQDYKHQRLDKVLEAEKERKPSASPEPAEETPSSPESKAERKVKRRQYLREYIKWLWPHRFGVGLVFALALVVAGLEMIEPLFMRFI